MKGGHKALEYPYQCTGCEARWDERDIDGSMEELQNRHRVRRCWQFPHEAYHHVIVDMREPIPIEFRAMEGTYRFMSPERWN
jgi:hypothetical protein